MTCRLYWLRIWYVSVLNLGLTPPTQLELSPKPKKERYRQESVQTEYWDEQMTMRPKIDIMNLPTCWGFKVHEERDQPPGGMKEPVGKEDTDVPVSWTCLSGPTSMLGVKNRSGAMEMGDLRLGMGGGGRTTGTSSLAFPPFPPPSRFCLCHLFLLFLLLLFFINDWPVLGCFNIVFMLYATLSWAIWWKSA